MGVNAYPASIDVLLAYVIYDIYLVSQRCYASLRSARRSLSLTIWLCLCFSLFLLAALHLFLVTLYVLLPPPRALVECAPPFMILSLLLLLLFRVLQRAVLHGVPGAAILHCLVLCSKLPSFGLVEDVRTRVMLRLEYRLDGQFQVGQLLPIG
jgi:hypothetical protein